MRILFGLVPAFAVIFALCFPVVYMNYARSEDQEEQAIRLAAAIDYAGESAMLSCLEADAIGTDYAENPEIQLSPRNAAYTFAAVLLLNCGLPVSERNIAYVQSHVPIMLLAETDGYYLAEHVDTGNGEVGLVFGIKRPYTIDTNPENPGDGTLYGVDLALSGWTAVDKRTLALTEGKDYTVLPYEKEQICEWINRDIDLAVNSALKRYALRYSLPQVQSFYLPLSAGAAGVRRIEKPTLIVVVEGLSFDGGPKYSQASVNGVSVSERRFVYGWADADGKWYAYADVLSGIEGELFLSPEDAAREGYWPWLG